MGITCEVVGKIIGKGLAYASHGYIISKVASSISPEGAIAVRVGAQYGVKLIQYGAKMHARKDFDSDVIFSDAIDASFDANT